MSEKYNGLPAQIKEMHPYAEFLPCFAHSLNLNGKYAAECNEEALNFFLFVGNWYTFFSAATHRWDLLISELRSQGSHYLIVKQLSDTRWSARSDALIAVF